MKLPKHAKFREESFGGVLFETRSEKVYSLNQAAAAIVREIAAAAGNEQQVVQRLRERFSDPNGTLEREALEYIADLRRKGLIED